MLELANYLKNRCVFLNIDVIGNLTKTGNWFTSLDYDYSILEKIIKKAPENTSILSINAE